MEQKRYKDIIEKAAFGYAYHKLFLTKTENRSIMNLLKPMKHLTSSQD